MASRILPLPVVSLLILLVAAPAWGASLSMGTARGVRAAEVSLDEGKNWLPLGPRPMPLLEGTQVRTTGGGAVVDLSDGSRLTVMPFTSLRFSEDSGRTRASLTHGRVGFRLPRETRVEISGPAVRLEPVRTTEMQGEFFVTREGTSGLKMAAGSIRVHELEASKPVQLASLEPVFLPKRPATTAPLFTSEAPSAPPASAKAVFDPRGQSLGYLGPDAQLVVQPGYTADLTQPFTARRIQLAMARIDEKDRAEAMPVFDVNGGYVGYMAGPVFYAQAQVAPGQVAQGQVAQAVAAPAAGGGVLGTSTAAAGTTIGSLGAVAGVTATGAGGGFGGGSSTPGRAATPVGP